MDPGVFWIEKPLSVPDEVGFRVTGICPASLHVFTDWRGFIFEPVHGQFPTQFAKISSTSGGFPNLLTDGDRPGIKMDVIGDLDNDGTPDLVVGATNLNPSLGSAFIIFLNPSGTVKGAVQIQPPEPGDSDSFGSAVGGIGDLDNDGVEDIAVGGGYDNPDGNRYALFGSSS